MTCGREDELRWVTTTSTHTVTIPSAVLARLIGHRGCQVVSASVHELNTALVVTLEVQTT